VTTPQFLAHFGLESLRELPGVEELRQSGLLDIGPAVLGEALGARVDGAEPAEDEEE
jgi:segregation and condensation protein B